ncbi:hypothetical protein [Amycolatopsis sp. CA-128772]|uniref:hypothetical protein n=1 Tax=Amycolatopsis sp. CA-128772 TaxID=2073159 RepID=UPI0011B020CC|nr:hypothetical protein [Amycolatopsis sp. CA-128772]
MPMLKSPAGDLYRTDDDAEVNTLVVGHGYSVLPDDEQPAGDEPDQAPADPEPAAEPATPTEPAEPAPAETAGPTTE